MDPGVVFPIFALLTLVTLLLAFLVAPGRAIGGGRLVVAGILLALVALWYSLLTNVPTRGHEPVIFGNPGLAEGLLKVAALLILGGIVTGLLTRDAGSVPPKLPERPRDVPPSV